MNNLNIDETQAAGGAGILFKYAKVRLKEEEFFIINKKIEGVKFLIETSPEPGGFFHKVNELSSKFGIVNTNLTSLADVIAGFSKLKLEHSMIHKFINEIILFGKEKGGLEFQNILFKVFSNLNIKHPIIN
ncbi:MAG: DUF2780 domain-containing protein [Ignavibacteria bacterium]|nr:DUF2780 domain-containing protein [Ignavibacteria bacterium]